ncbi:MULTISPECIES: Asp-tRNA(Asn)/Glu-tRNA(Gln) amidotransferase subunit GatA [Helicobacter]|uniref:Glutamyl-tRNA(Gln) amidotransferase subunit A n=1 Tax=Helicobacter ibis TaxID=2962633 RepID=A0ABT4VEG5_9HELI|nr:MULTISPECIES: Asp-tRNA(Asn)/Glu-tRNA(Gln) amidotransferase subunit GatA [Helicobacter]MDA3967460.1 Asp-tRNA(Asn)/Glu-tRNA(Gln) amidotransferase subunit GatA [Helicobacter sp. WB40]MDA3969099.1 Asp-tRNA(Asn)/Glu-tRNA(Gln) amidotransferase subunit GatA [Helicobacter ibis]
MPTLKEALQLDKDEILQLKATLKEKIKNSDLNAYVGEILDYEDSLVPIAIKDNINVKNWEITCSSNILKGYIAPYNATAISNMLKNRLSPFGRTNMDEFAMGSTTASSCYGKTLNPKDKSKVPGGSSGGSAAAVAGGIAIAALGSDTGGSIRQPASFCGCVGLKPTYGRVSRYGLVAYSSSLDQIGPITQNVEDCAILFDAISGYDSLDSTSAKLESTNTFKNLNPNNKMTIAIMPSLLKDAEANIQNAYQNTIDILSKNGHKIVEKEMLDTSYIISAYYIICTAEASSNLARFDGVRYGNRAKDINNLKELYIKTRSQGFGEEVKRRILLGSFVLSSGYYDAYYIKAQKVRTLIARQYNEILSECDAILSPITPSIAFGFDDIKTPLQMYLEDIYTIGVNLAGLPAISLPVCEDNGLPIGMQLIGNAFDEQKILDLALNLEQSIK